MKIVFDINSETKKNIFFFGHCRATEELIDIFIDNGYEIQGILDNSKSKQGNCYNNIEITAPEKVLNKNPAETIVYIASRHSASMIKQLNQMGYAGKIENVMNFNSFSEYSLSYDTITKKTERLERGKKKLNDIKEKYLDFFLVVCPYAALGDVYNAMAYLPHYLKDNHICKYVVITVGTICSQVAKMFGCENVEAIDQNDMDELVQAILYLKEKQALIAHHDRPYSNELIRSINVKKIKFEELYRTGVYGLGDDVHECVPTKFNTYPDLECIKKGKTVIISPYAKSVAPISKAVWEEVVAHYKKEGYSLYTNIAGEEEALEGTLPIEVPISMMQSVVEYAGVFIGIRSGLCDVIKNARCRKIALFPDCYYSNTEMKVIDFFQLAGWENVVEKGNW